jgi:hypothetical protein
MNRATRRAAYRDICRILKAESSAKTIANVRAALEQFTGNPRRPIDAGDAGAWLPAFSFSAMAQALKDAERQLANRRG